jgi:sulfite reductase alpha subunit-like flavoprotein
MAVNDDARVARTIAALKEVPTQRIPTRIPARDGADYLPQNLTAAEAIAHTVDLTRPTKELLALAIKPTNERYHALAAMPVEEFLEQPGIKGSISFAQLLANQPPLANRKYTPSRVDVEHGQIGIMVSEVHEGPYRGTSSGYLADLAKAFDPAQTQTVNAFLDIREKKPIKLPYDKAGDKPIILVSTGVGIAPHLSMLRATEHPNVGLMLSGGRTADDELCGDEIRQLLGDHASNYNYVPSTQGHYVQAELLAQGDKVWDILHEQGGSIYLCGLEHMKDAVLNTLTLIGEQHGVNGQYWVSQLERHGHIFDSTSHPDRFMTKWRNKHDKAEGRSFLS